MTEKIGGVTLDYTWYPGEDLYSDGSIEERLLEIAKSASEEELNKVIAREHDWAVLYHFSHIRENIVSSLPLSDTDKVLEIGAGCGAVTGALARRAGSVTCVDLSKKRSLVNAYRHASYDNIRILVGNYRDIEPNLTQKYDCITLIGVFEYAKAYIGTDAPYETFLRQIASHLAPGGKLVIAIENRLGLKYWAGCMEDHTGHAFEGIEDYPDPSCGVHTFTRGELEQLLSRTGFGSRSFYYPYPDYKLPFEIYSDAYLPGDGAFRQSNWNFDRQRAVFFDEDKAAASLVESGLYPVFANSYLVLASQGEPGEMEQSEVAEKQTDAAPVYSRFSNERDSRFNVQTDIVRDSENGTLQVIKRACADDGKAHIEALAWAGDALTDLFKDTQIRISPIISRDDLSVTFAYEGEASPDGAPAAHAQTLEQQVRASYYSAADDETREEALRPLDELAELIRGKADVPFAPTEDFAEHFSDKAMETFTGEDLCMPVTDLDMTAENLLAGPQEGLWTLIDYEWTYSFPVPAEFVIFRLYYYFWARNVSEAEAESFCAGKGFSDRQIRIFRQMEQCWQKYVAGGHIPLREMYESISPGSLDLRGSFDASPRADRVRKETTYQGSLCIWNEGDDTAGSRCLPVVTRVEEDGHFRALLQIGLLFDDAAQSTVISALRWDPLEHAMCRIRIDSAVSEGYKMIRPLNGFPDKEGDDFWTFDPAYVITGDIRAADTILLEGSLTILDPARELATFSHVRAERDAYFEEMQNLRARVSAMKGTLGYKGMEGLRRARNYTMARVRGTYLFRDKNAGPRKYQWWLRQHSASEDTLAAQRRMVLPGAPLISLLVPVYRTDETYLRAMIESVTAQTYTSWQLCIADGSEEGEDGPTGRILREYAEKDPRICVKTLEKNEGISENTNAAARLAQGEYLALLDHDDLLAPDALFEVAAAIIREKADVLYTDEDKVNMLGTDHFEPNLKPEFSPDLLRSHNYITHLFVIRRTLFTQLGGFRKAYDGAQDYDLILRATEKAEKIVHIPKILYYWRCHDSSTASNPRSKMYAYEAGRKAIQDHLERCGLKGEVEISKYWGIYHVKYAPQDAPEGVEPLVSIIIPNKDHAADLDTCIRSIIKKSDWKNLEILVVENNSTEPATFAYYKRLREEISCVRLLKWEGAFNYSAINNYAASRAKGEYLLLLNNDTELIEKGSIREMVGLASRKDMGAVGARLLYADNTIQHAGIVLGFGGFAGHVFTGLERENPAFMMRPLMVCNYSAVTAACMMVRKEVYDSLGGLDESYAVALNDVDFCMRIREAGYLITYTPWAEWHHYESKSRGYEDTPEKQERFRKEISHFRERWATVVDVPDPYYNPQFSVDDPPFSLW